MITLLDELSQCDHSWQDALSDQRELLCEIEAFLVEKETQGPVYPVRGNRLAALKSTSLSDVKAVIMAQDPYPTAINGEPNAMGLALSVRKGMKIPASLKNMYKELYDSLGIPSADHGDLTKWAKQGVLLLNVLLTIDEGVPKSHLKSGWREFTNAVISCVVSKSTPVVFLSFGRDSHACIPFFEEKGHPVVKTSHPSPLGARKQGKNGSFPAFLGSNCFALTNEHLRGAGCQPIDWSLENTQGELLC